MTQVERGNEILSGIFKDLDLQELKAGDQPLEAVLADRLIDAAGLLEGDSTGDPLVVARLQSRLAVSLSSLGYSDDAVGLLRKALSTQSALLDPEDPEKLTTQSNLAGALFHTGELDESISLAKTTLESMKTVLGPDHSDTLNCVNILAAAYCAAGRVEESIPLLEQAYQQCKEKSGSDASDTLLCMTNLAAAYEAAEKLDKALPLLEEALELTRSKWGEKNFHTMQCMYNLAKGYSAAGQMDKAVDLNKRTLELRKSILGDNHPDTLMTMANLAADYWRQGKLDQSIALFEQILPLQSSRLGRKHQDTQLTVANLGVNYRDAGRLDEAIPLLKEAYASSQTNPKLTWVGHELLDAYDKSGKHRTEVIQLAGKLAKNAKHSLPTGSRELADELVDLGVTLLDNRAFSEAEPQLAECLAIRQSVEPEKWTTFSAQSLLGAALLGQQKYDAAEPLLKDGYNGLKARSASIPDDYRVQRLSEALQRLVELAEGETTRMRQLNGSGNWNR